MTRSDFPDATGVRPSFLTSVSNNDWRAFLPFTLRHDLLVDASSLLLNGTIGQLAVIVVDLQKSVVSWNSGLVSYLASKR